jgi:hypothetical protein
MHMKILITALLGLLVIAQPAAAQWRHQGGKSYDGGRHLGVQSQRPRQGGYDRGQPPREFRQPDRRDYRQPERGGDYRQPDRRHDGRLTDEERYNLRRDLDRANREIYKGR